MLEYPLSSCFILGFFFFFVVVPVLSGFASIIWVPWGGFFSFLQDNEVPRFIEYLKNLSK